MEIGVRSGSGSAPHLALPGRQDPTEGHCSATIIFPLEQQSEFPASGAGGGSPSGNDGPRLLGRCSATEPNFQKLDSSAPHPLSECRHTLDQAILGVDILLRALTDPGGLVAVFHRGDDPGVDDGNLKPVGELLAPGTAEVEFLDRNGRTGCVATLAVTPQSGRAGGRTADPPGPPPAGS